MISKIRESTLYVCIRIALGSIYCYFRGKHDYYVIFDYLGEKPPHFLCSRCFSVPRFKSLNDYWPWPEYKEHWG